MAALPALRPIACVAALNSAVQGLVWVVFSVLALCVCFCGLGVKSQSQANDLAQYLTSYLQGDECLSKNRLYTDVTSPTAMRVWMALSLFFSASMCISSVILFIAVAKRWSDEKLQITLVSWLFINIFTAVDDLILGYVFGHDYLSVLDSSSQQNSVGTLALALITFLAVRGFYLWLFNMAFIVYLFTGALALHNFLNEQMPAQNQEPIESWPTLDDFGKSKVADIERTPIAVNHRLSDRENDAAQSAYPDYTAMARWPTLNGQAQTLRETRPEKAREDSREQRAKTVREYSFRQQEGIDNPVYENEENKKYYLRLQSDTGSTRDYEEFSTDLPVKNNRDRDRDLPRNLRREFSNDSTFGQYKQKSSDPWNEKNIPLPPSPEYLEENGVPIPPVDYLDPQLEETRNMSLQEAILDRTLRLKKVPEALKKGLKN